MRRFRSITVATTSGWLIFSAIAVCYVQQTIGQSPRRFPGQRQEQKQLQPGEIDVSASRVYILVGKTGLGHEHGVVGRLKSGSISLGGAPAAGLLEFDMTSFVADTAAARKYVGLTGTTSESTAQSVTKNMLGASVLNVARYPTATFAIDSVRPLKKQRFQDPQRYQLDGEFTLHGTARKIRVIAESEGANGLVHLRGSFAILQSEFGITPYSQAFGAVGVADRLEIWGDLWLAPEKDAAN